MHWSFHGIAVRPDGKLAALLKYMDKSFVAQVRSWFTKYNCFYFPLYHSKSLCHFFLKVEFQPKSFGVSQIGLQYSAMHTSERDAVYYKVVLGTTFIVDGTTFIVDGDALFIFLFNFKFRDILIGHLDFLLILLFLLVPASGVRFLNNY